MTKKKVRATVSKKGRKPPTPTTTWIAGVFEVPAFVGGEKLDPYRPVIALVLAEDGRVRGRGLARPEDVDEAVADAFMQSLSDPLVGDPELPRRVIVQTASLAAFFHKRLSQAEIVIGPTPGIDALEAAMRRDLGTAQDGEGVDKDSYVTAHATADDVAGFFAAAAELYERAPWRVVPNDQCVLRFTAKALGVDGVVACVLGKLGESYGVLFFDSVEEYDTYRAMASLGMRLGKMPPTMPRQAALSYERGVDVAEARRKEVKAHGWRVAGPAAYPELILVEPDLVQRPPTGADYRCMEALVLALCRMLDREPDLAQAWQRDDSRARRFTLDLRGAKVTVSVAIAHAR